MLNKLNDSYKVVDYTWINTLSGLIGIVVVENKIQHKICYIGIVDEPKSEAEDAQHIVSFGSVFPIPAAQHFFPYLENLF